MIPPEHIRLDEYQAQLERYMQHQTGTHFRWADVRDLFASWIKQHHRDHRNYGYYAPCPTCKALNDEHQACGRMVAEASE